MLTALAGRREEPVAGEPRPRKAVGAAAGQRVAARDPSPLRRPASGGRSSARSHGRSSPDRRLRFCEMTWPNEKPRNLPEIVGRDSDAPHYFPCLQCWVIGDAGWQLASPIMN